ncbi:FtsX-like permease family protein [Flavobacteriaceae bacterium R38]|nr:FtsX-like permease family protein [Flavobacteriaceae bacterium R38]
MFNRDRWREILEVLTTNWFRTLLTAFGVFWGIFILILLLAVGKGLETGVKLDFGNSATNTVVVWTQTVSKPYKGLPKGRRYNFKIDDVESIRENVDHLRFISPRNQLGGFRGTDNVVRGINTGAFNVYGDYPEIIQQDPMNITAGRFLNYSDINEKRKVAVIGEGVRATLYDKTEDPIGTFIKIRGVSFMVVGTYDKEFGGGDQEEEENEIYVPFSAFSQAFNMGDNVGWMSITANDGYSISDIKESIFGILKQNHKIHPDDVRAVGHFDRYAEYSRVERLFTALNLIAYFVGILVLLSGVIGVSNIMLIVVKERTKEIGIRRALGEKPWSIRIQILMESVFLTIISGMCGIILSTLLIYVINYILEANGPVDLFSNPNINIGVVIIALTILIVSGLLAGLIPAQNAIRVRPVEAIRTD